MDFALPETVLLPYMHGLPLIADDRMPGFHLVVIGNDGYSTARKAKDTSNDGVPGFMDGCLSLVHNASINHC
jgi:hypothetical protein